MKPLDPRLLTYARASRVFLALAVLVGVATALLVVAQAALVAQVVDAAFLGGQGLDGLHGQLVALAVVVAGRALLAWVGELTAQWSAGRVLSQLRRALLDRVVRLAPGGRVSAAEVSSLATRGMDDLETYVARYLPELVLAVVVPLTVLVVLLTQDLVAALVVAVTLPLVPLLMAVVGMATRTRTTARLRTLHRLAGHFLDVVAGLPTLKVFGRAKAQASAIRRVSEDYRRTTMSTLRLAFVSSLVLELVATLSVAFVAVSVGLRLLDAQTDFRTALFVLLLAPEAYLPLRRVGASFHASADGVAAAERVLELVQTPDAPRGTRTDVPDPAVVGVRVEGVRVTYPDRSEPALAAASCVVEPGKVLALVGPSGCGKSTLLGVLLGLVQPDAGRVLVGAVDLAELDPDAWRSRVSWVPQRPYLFAGTLEANVRLGRPDASDQQVAAAVAAAGLEPVLDRLPDGLGTTVGDRGAGLSAGERQRVALARAFLRDTPLLLLDEPTAGLDAQTEATVLDAVRRLVEGRTVVLVAHRPSLLTLADRVVDLGATVAPHTALATAVQAGP